MSQKTGAMGKKQKVSLPAKRSMRSLVARSTPNQINRATRGLCPPTSPIALYFSRRLRVRMPAHFVFGERGKNNADQLRFNFP
jgi:hypothetical protein